MYVYIFVVSFFCREREARSRRSVKHVLFSGQIGNIYIYGIYSIVSIYEEVSLIPVTPYVTGMSDRPDLNRSPFFTSAALFLAFFSFLDRTKT